MPLLCSFLPLPCSILVFFFYSSYEEKQKELFCLDPMQRWKQKSDLPYVIAYYWAKKWSTLRRPFFPPMAVRLCIATRSCQAPDPNPSWGLWYSVASCLASCLTRQVSHLQLSSHWNQVASQSTCWGVPRSEQLQLKSLCCPFSDPVPGRVSHTKFSVGTSCGEGVLPLQLLSGHLC